MFNIANATRKKFFISRKILVKQGQGRLSLVKKLKFAVWCFSIKCITTYLAVRGKSFEIKLDVFIYNLSCSEVK